MRSQSKGLGSVDFRVNGLKNPYDMSRYGCLDQSNHHSVGMSSDSCDITAPAQRRSGCVPRPLQRVLGESLWVRKQFKPLYESVVSLVFGHQRAGNSERSGGN